MFLIDKNMKVLMCERGVKYLYVIFYVEFVIICFLYVCMYGTNREIILLINTPHFYSFSI